jgi:hypothetical protein
MRPAATGRAAPATVTRGRRRPPSIVCVRCGRIGTRGFVISSDDPWQGPGPIAWTCASAAACERRERQAEAEAEARAGVSVYRCGECGHGKHLIAWAVMLAHGPLGPDGHLAHVDYDEEDFLWEDSIQCARHPDGPLEIDIGGQWHRWWNCPLCHGRGEVTAGQAWQATKRQCPMPGARVPDAAGKQPVHGCWWPLSEPWPVSTLDRAGHVFTPGVDPYCRHCGVPAQSISGQEKPCPGAGHRCPAAVAEGTSDTAFRVHGGDGRWFCGQPGTMNGGFTQWRCGHGHLITQAGHLPPGEQHEDVCPAAPFQCPWEYLTAPGPAGAPVRKMEGSA